jgi:hypothetical protein
VWPAEPPNNVFPEIGKRVILANEGAARRPSPVGAGKGDSTAAVETKVSSALTTHKRLIFKELPA